MIYIKNSYTILYIQNFLTENELRSKKLDNIPISHKILINSFRFQIIQEQINFSKNLNL